MSEHRSQGRSGEWVVRAPVGDCNRPLEAQVPTHGSNRDCDASVERARALAEPSAFEQITDPALRKVLRAYLVNGRLPVLPRGATKRAMLLEYLATAFEPGVRYREVDVNQTVAVWNSDVAALRRYLVDAGLMARENGLYWRCGGWV